MRLLISVLDHHLKDDEYKSAFVSAKAALEVIGDRDWKDSLAFAPVISAVIAIARMLVLSTAATSYHSSM